MDEPRLQEIRIRLVSSQYRFLRGKAVIAGSSPLTKSLLLPDKRRGEDLAGRLDVPTVPFENGLTAGLRVFEPGTVLVILMDVEAVRIEDSRHTVAPFIPIGEYEITYEDLRTGVKDLIVKPFGNVRIKVLDERSHQPVPTATVSIRAENSEASHEFTTDENGELTLLVLPAGKYQYQVYLAHGRPSRGSLEILEDQELTMSLIAP